MAAGEIEIGSDIQQVKPEYVPTIDEDGDNEGEELGENLKSAQASDLQKKDYSTKEREKMADKGEAEPDGSFPIKTA